MTNSRFFLSIAAAISISALVGLVQLAPAQDAAASLGSNANVAGGCNTNKLAFKTLTSLDSTTSASFAPMPGTQRAVTTSANSCIIVDFAGETAAAVGLDRMEIRAFASSLVGEPPSVLMGFGQPPPSFRTRSMRFVFKDVPAGTHNVGIAWRSEQGGPVSIRNRTLTIEYR
jgi:hypothetical protein